MYFYSFRTLAGPEDVTLNYNYSPNGLYQQSVTLTARMWPPIEAGSPKVVWGLPVVVWCIVFGCLLVVILILVALLLCCWLLPKRRKVLSPTRFEAASQNGCATGVGPTSTGGKRSIYLKKK